METVTIKGDGDRVAGWSINQVQVPTDTTFPRYVPAGATAWIAGEGWRLAERGRDPRHAGIRVLRLLVAADPS